MATDPTERVVGKILKSLGEVQAWVDGDGAMRVHIPGVKPEMMTAADQILLEEIRFRQQWRFPDWKTTAKALNLGRKMMPDHVWSFYHLDAIESDPKRKRWVITAHRL